MKGQSKDCYPIRWCLEDHICLVKAGLLADDQGDRPMRGSITTTIPASRWWHLRSAGFLTN